MAGEHGAMLVCSQLVENVHGQDAKLFQASQVVDEARHNEVLHRYITLRLDGKTYPLAGNVREIFGTLSLPAVVAEASATERREMEDFTVWALKRTLTGLFPLAAYEEMGFDGA